MAYSHLSLYDCTTLVSNLSDRTTDLPSLNLDGWNSDNFHHKQISKDVFKQQDLVTSLFKLPFLVQKRVYTCDSDQGQWNMTPIAFDAFKC